MKEENMYVMKRNKKIRKRYNDVEYRCNFLECESEEE